MIPSGGHAREGKNMETVKDQWLPRVEVGGMHRQHGGSGSRTPYDTVTVGSGHYTFARSHSDGCDKTGNEQVMRRWRNCNFTRYQCRRKRQVPHQRCSCSVEALKGILGLMILKSYCWRLKPCRCQRN